MLAGCAHTWDCQDYGIPLTGESESLVSINELVALEIEKVCGKGKIGCVIEGRVYYRTGDQCALRHELCHVENGPYHTVEYHQRLIRGQSACGF